MYCPKVQYDTPYDQIGPTVLDLGAGATGFGPSTSYILVYSVLETCFGRLQALIGPHAPPRVLNGSQWTTYCAMRIPDIIFHYRKSGHCLQERWTKSDDLRHVLAVFRLKWPPQGPLRVPKGSRWPTQCAMSSRDEIFYYGMISLWDNWALLV